MSGGEGFLSRWSRRKREAAEAPPAAPAPLEADAVAAAELGDSAPAVPGEGLAGDGRPAAPGDGRPAAPGDGRTAAPGDGRPAAPGCPIPGVAEIDPASLPPVEGLTAESDFGLFLRPGVPAALRNAALRRMWSLDPAIRDYIGPVDYQWDFNTPGGLPFGFANELTGDVSKLLAQAIGRIEELAEEEIPGPPAAGTAAPPDAAPPDAATATAPGAEAAAEVTPPAPGEVTPPAPLAGSPIPAPPEAAALPEPAMRARRHGGALPS